MGKRKKSGAMNGAAEVKVEGRDYVFRGCQLARKAGELKGLLKTFEKKLKTTVEKLAKEVDRGVVEGRRSGLLFPSLEAATLQAQEVTLLHLEIGLGVATRLQDVALDDLESVRAKIAGVLDSAATVKAEAAEDDPEAAGGDEKQPKEHAA